jgi:hypothetical protein
MGHGRKMPDSDLQKLIVQFTSDAARRYAEHNGMFPPERYIQCFVGDRLMDHGFGIWIEPSRTDYAARFHQPIDYVGGFKIDLLVFEPDEGDRLANPRAIVEFKYSTNWKVGDDITKVQSLLKGFSTPVFGLVISLATSDQQAFLDAEIGEAHRLADERGLVPIIDAPFDERIDGCPHRGVVTGFPIGSSRRNA